MVKAVIFDVDGTLIDSVDLHARAWQDIFLKYGVKTDFEEVREQIGKGGDKLMKVFLSKDQIDLQGKEIEAERVKLFKREYLPQVKPFAGLQGLFERLRENGIKIALATSAKDDELRAYKKITGIGTFLAADTTADDVSNSKPDPDVFRAAQKKLGIDSRNIVAIGDTQYDAESAGQVGMATIGLLCGGSNPAKLLAAGCIALYRDPADLLKRFYDSPLASRGTRSGSFSGTSEYDKKKEKPMNSNNTLYFLMGLGVGAAVGLLYAPNSGSETRDLLRSKSEEGAKYAKQVAIDAAELAKDKTDELKKAGVESLESGKQALNAQLETISSAVEAGKKAYRQASSGTPANPAEFAGVQPARTL